MRLQDDMQIAKTVPWPTAALNVLRKIQAQTIPSQISLRAVTRSTAPKIANVNRSIDPERL
jgi:hypothetical protein